MLPRLHARGGLSMTRITRRKTPDENESIGVPAVRAMTDAARPGSEAFWWARSAHGASNPHSKTCIVAAVVWLNESETRPFVASRWKPPGHSRKEVEAQLTNFAW